MIDLDALLVRMENDEELMNEMIEVFLDGCPELLDELQKAIESGEPKQLELRAHGIKGACANMCAQRMMEISMNMETMGREGHMADEQGKSAQDHFKDLKEEYTRLEAYLKRNHAKVSS